MPEDIVLDTAPEIETPVASAVETDNTPTEDVETPETPEGEQPETPTEPEEDEEPVLNGTKLSEKAKATLAEIKAKDPKLAAHLKGALYAADAFKKAFPGGTKEVTALKDTLSSVGGVDGIQALKQEAQDWEALDNRFTSGDPKFVDDIAEAAPDAFLKLAPSFFSKFSELSPEGYGAYVSQVFVADMMANNIPLALERMQDFIGDNPKAQEIWKQLAGYVNRINSLSKQEVKAPAKKEEAKPDDTERVKFQQEKEEFTRNQWRTAADTNRMSTFNSEWTRQTAGLKVSDGQQAAIKELYVSRLGAALKKTPGFNETVDKYFKASDQQGYVRYISSIYKQEIPKALRSAVEAVMPGRKPGPKPGQQPAATTPKPAATGEAGYSWVAAQPKSSAVDWSRTDISLIAKGRAVLADGKKVQWKT